MDLIRKEQLASYVVAIMQADWNRPSACEMKDILRAASQQVDAIELESRVRLEAEEPALIVRHSAS
jgi:hypothetical protein